MLKLKICLRISLSQQGVILPAWSRIWGLFLFSVTVSFILFHAWYPCATAVLVPLLPSLCLYPLQSQHFREKKYTNIFIHSFIPFLPPPCLQNKQEAICAWWLIIRFLRGDYAEHHWCTHSRLRWRSMSWQHSPVNTIQVPSCWPREL